MEHGPLLVLGILLSSARPLLAHVAQDAARADRLLLKIDRALPASDGDALASTGAPALDRALANEGVRTFERVFRHPPRGWRDPEAAERFGLDRWLVVGFGEERRNVRAIAKRLEGLAAIELCQLDEHGTVTETLPDDPIFPGQYALQNGYLNAPQAWDLVTDSDHVVAVVDTGTELDHPDLVNNLWSNPGEIPDNDVDDDGNGYVDDVVGWDLVFDDNMPEDGYGHGIHVSGIIGASGNNALQVAGVCWNVPIMEVRVFNQNGAGPKSRAAAGIVYAADNGASVINNSYAYFINGQVLQDAVDYAAALDIVVVAAAGNQANDTPVYPAGDDAVMGIIATDANDEKPHFSCYGPWCDMAAPGNAVLNLWFAGGVMHANGTSMASPHVAGAAALVRAANPSLDAIDTRWLLNHSAFDLGSPGKDDLFGWGRLDLYAAVRRAQSLSISTSVASPGDSVTLELNQPGEPGFTYVVLASRRGRVPGLPASAFGASDARQIPLNADPLLFSLIMNNPAGTPLFTGFVGVLDGSGKATAVVHVPRRLAKLELDFVGLTFDPASPTTVASISASNHLEVDVELQPAEAP